MSGPRGKKKNSVGEKDYDSDDDKCFLRRNMIYTFIRIVVPDFPRRWCIMMVTVYMCVYVCASVLVLVFHGGQIEDAEKKRPRLHRP